MSPSPPAPTNVPCTRRPLLTDERAAIAPLPRPAAPLLTRNRACRAGIFVEDSTDNLQAAAYDAGLAAMKVGEKAWEYDNPDAAEPAIATGTSNKMAWALSYPSSVCDYMPSITAAGSNGIYYPHPFASFGNDIKNSLIAVNGATGALAILVAVLAGNLRSSVRAVTYAQYP